MCDTLYFVNEVSYENLACIFELDKWGSVEDKILPFSDTPVQHMCIEWQEVRLVLKAMIIYKVKCSNSCHHSICNIVFVYGV